MSLLGSRKFWATRMRWRTRCCYMSGFCYYVHTALFTFVAPAIPLVMLIFMPERVRLINYLFIVPSIIYNLVVFPAWHRCRFGPEALMAKLLYGWAHVFALWDICRRKRMGWQPTGGGKRKAGTRRVWVGVTVVERRHRPGLGDAGGVAHDPLRPGFRPAAGYGPARLR